MRFNSRIRTWINRDDGRYFRVGNKSLDWHEVTGYLLLVLSLGLFGIPTLEGELVRRLATATFVLAIVLLIGGAVMEIRNGNDGEF